MKANNGDLVPGVGIVSVNNWYLSYYLVCFRNFPFAPRCLGVAAKRDVSHSYHIETDIDDTYEKLKSL